MRTKIFAWLAVFILLGAFQLFAQPTDYPALKGRAETLYAEGSFAQAHTVYEQIKKLPLTPEEARWTDFRLADTLWRSAAATETADSTEFDNARRALEALIRDVQRTEDRDLVWAEVQESLGDFFWTRRNAMNWTEAWLHYQAALDWWAGARDIELARKRYLKIVWTITQRPAWFGRERNYYYYNYGASLPLEILENAAKVAQSPEDQARAHYLLALALENQAGDEYQRRRIPEEFEAAIKPGKSTDWYDDALYQYAQWMLGNGRIIPFRGGGWTREPDYPKALELFRRLTREFREGETRYYDQVRQEIANITGPVVSVTVANVFLPDSEIQYQLNWRNVKQIEFTLYAVNLTRDVQLSTDNEKRNDWLQSINLSNRQRVKSWTYDTHDKGDYKPGSEAQHLDGKLPMGAYVLEARGGGQSSRELVLITDTSVVLKTSGKQALVYFCDALRGSPLADGEVTLCERYYDGSNHAHRREQTKKTDANGLAVFDLVANGYQEEIFVGAKSNDRQAFVAGNSFYWWARSDKPDWRIYAFTDRPAYRPNETVQWKFIARKRANGAAYSTPANELLKFRITDPRGTKVKEGKVTLNSFGSAWGSLDLTETMPLGEYRVTFLEAGDDVQIGEATLFRLEEYKLPEFKVSVQTPEENGRKKAFRLGEKIQVTVQSDYYFGGPVSDASVEVVVHQNPFYHFWHRPREYPWFYDDASEMMRRGYYGGEGPIIKRETLKTDANGKVTFSFDTPNDPNQDFEYQIEARVTDASRREITGHGSVRVTRQRYYVYPEPEHNIYHPQDKVQVEFKALDANDEPVATEGTVKVTRDVWYEIWLDPDGKEVSGEELRNYRSRSLVFPPPPLKPGDHPWQLKFRGYQHDEILTRTLKTDTNGVAEMTFTPERDGYYHVAWSSEQKAASNAPPLPPITAETAVWVATGATTELGYRHGGVEIIVDKDTFRVGQKAPVMLTAPANDSYVLFSVEGEDLYSYQLVHLTGTAKLIELPIEEKFVPNIFLSATMVNDRQIFTDSKSVVVPPTKNFLNLEVTSDRQQYQPRESGTFTITTRDDHNQPVSAEVAFGLVDESVYYIQSDYAGDPRQFYFGDKRSQQVQTASTFNQKGYAKLVKADDDQYLDIRDVEKLKRRKWLLELEGAEAAESYMISTNFVEMLGNGAVEDESAALGIPIQNARAAGIAGQLDSLAVNQSMPEAAFAAETPVVTGTYFGGFASRSANATAPMIGRSLAKEPAFQMAATPPSAAEPQEPAVQVRSDFRSTVFWQPDVHTGPDGKATVKVTYPDSLTSWKSTARAVTEVNQFGIATTNTHTKQPLIVRLEAPRFFVVGDQVTISAVVNNNTEKEQEVRVWLTPDVNGVLSDFSQGPKHIPAGWSGATGGFAEFVTVPPNGEARVDWYADVKTAGNVKLKVSAKTKSTGLTDAMEKTLPAYEHGIEKFIAKSGKTRGDDVTVKLNLPKERKVESTTLNVQITPSMAVTMLDALPYLIHYPYGCTEQTMSRFLPAAITAKTLKDLGLKPEFVMDHLFGGIEPATAAATHPQGKHNLDELNTITQKSLERLYDFQHGDGGWGWWKEGESDHFMTAYVVWGLTLARDGGINVKSDALSRAVKYLDKSLVDEENNYDEQAWMLHALSARHASLHQDKISAFQKKAFDNLWTHREQLNAYTRALLALSAHQYGFTDQAKILVANLENGVKMDNSPDTSVLISEPSTLNHQPSTISTAHWGEDGIYWRWSDGGVEATAFALRALLAIDPQNKLVEPVCNWLIKNRRGAQWSNTRDTAITVLVLNDYLRASGELTSDLNYELLVNGHAIATNHVSGAEIFSAPSRFAITADFIRDGENDVRIVRRGGHGPIYFAASASYYSLEEPIPPAGNEIFVRRQYYKLVGRPTLLKGYVYDRQPLNDGDSVRSGDRVETVVTIEAKNNYEYLLFEDLKPAGLEAVEVRSGESLYAYELKSGAVERKFGTNAPEAKPSPTIPPARKDIIMPNGKRRVLSGRISRPLIPRPNPDNDEDHTGRSRWVYQELRDRKIALFIDHLPQGVWEIKYDLRAEVPGKFHALPVVGHAMYVPEIRCNGAEVRITVEEGK